NRGSGGQQNSSDNFLVNIQNGITTTHAAGLNYSDAWGKKVTVSGSYFFNATQNIAVTNLLRQYIIGTNNGLNYKENNTGTSDNYNHRFSLRMECKLDSQNTIIFQPKASLQINNGQSVLFGQNTNLDIIASNTSNTFKSRLNAYNFSLPLQFRHSFAKKGRTISFDVNPTYNSSGGNNNLRIYNNFYSDSLYSDTVNQKSILTKSGINSTGSVVYTEPLGKHGALSVNYTGSYNYTGSEKNTFDKDHHTYEYSVRDTLLSNVFNSQYQSHAGGLTYRYQKEKFNFSFGSSYQHAELYKEQKFPANYALNKTFESVLPNATFQYKYSQKKNLRVVYRANTNAPSVDQLQDVLNNSNSLQLSIGNPNLKQTYQHNLNCRYSSVNTEKSTSTFFLLSGTYADDYISSNTTIAGRDMLVYNDIFLAKGSQITRPENVNGYYNARALLTYSFPIKKLKTNVNLNVGGSYNNVPAIINHKINNSNTTNSSLGIVLSSNISEKIDFMISATPSYNYVSNTLQRSSNSTYFNQLSKAKVTITPVKWLVFQAEYNNQYYNGLTGGFNQNISLLNGAVAYKFLKDQRAELRLYVFDILKQNNSIQRNTTQTYIEDTQTNILQRYFMLTFTYNIKKFFQKVPEKAKDK
ncbi:MAG TPA: outer membrane beta-barrel protein, partial [Bacteroidia bacterium]|nr:outer membrane beta-barrel protein [Bacteroidia bacterium]